MTEEISSPVLVPQAVREVPFYEDVLLVALVEDIAYVALRPIANFLGLQWAPQYQRIQRDDVLSQEVRLVRMASADGRQREMISLPLEFLPGWLFGVTVSKARPELAPKLTRYRRECFKVLWRAFQTDLTPAVPASTSTSSLKQVRDLALAVAQMAEQQLELQAKQVELQGQMTIVNSRVDRAAVVVRDLQVRLSAVERNVGPGALISDAQAVEISNNVKALAELMTQKEGSKNHYQGVFAELYRRFGISSYKLVQQKDYQAVLKFLDDWRETIQKGKHRE